MIDRRQSESAGSQGERNALAGIAYHGVAGSSQDCLDAVLRLLVWRSAIHTVRLLTHHREHALLLSDRFGDLIAIKSGFASGYGGEGPRALSKALTALLAHGAEVSEYEVDAQLLKRLDRSALTLEDLELFSLAREVRPSRVSEYVDEEHHRWLHNGHWMRSMPDMMPFGLLDGRLADVAVVFWRDPDHAVMMSHRRLETLVRKRTGGLSLSGGKLYRKAFGELLTWRGIQPNERSARAELFANVTAAYRNPRMHNEVGTRDALSEFLLINHLFRLESEAVEAPPQPDKGPSERIDSTLSAKVGASGTE